MSKQIVIQQVIQQVFKELGLDHRWTMIETLDNGCKFLLENQELLTVLPKRVLGNLKSLNSDVAGVRRRCLLHFLRRCAKLQDSAIIRKRKQVRVKEKTISKYSYRLITA